MLAFADVEAVEREVHGGDRTDDRQLTIADCESRTSSSAVWANDESILAKADKGNTEKHGALAYHLEWTVREVLSVDTDLRGCGVDILLIHIGGSLFESQSNSNSLTTAIYIEVHT